MEVWERGDVSIPADRGSLKTPLARAFGALEKSLEFMGFWGLREAVAFLYRECGVLCGGSPADRHGKHSQGQVGARPGSAQPKGDRPEEAVLGRVKQIMAVIHEASLIGEGKLELEKQKMTKLEKDGAVARSRIQAPNPNPKPNRKPTPNPNRLSPGQTRAPPVLRGGQKERPKRRQRKARGLAP